MEKLMNKEQTAKILGIKLATLNAWVSKRRIEFVKLGSRVLFEPRAIERFIHENTQAAAK